MRKLGPFSKNVTFQNSPIPFTVIDDVKTNLHRLWRHPRQQHVSLFYYWSVKIPVLCSINYIIFYATIQLIWTNLAHRGFFCRYIFKWGSRKNLYASMFSSLTTQGTFICNLCMICESYARTQWCREHREDTLYSENRHQIYSNCFFPFYGQKNPLDILDTLMGTPVPPILSCCYPIMWQQHNV